MASLIRTLPRRGFSQGIVAPDPALKAVLSRLPWNFNPAPARCEVLNLKSTVPVQKLMGHNIATAMLKDLAEGLATHDMELLSGVLEPSFMKRITPTIQEAKKGLDDSEHQFYLENFRGHACDFFLYNVENFMLVGTDSVDPDNRISLDRSLNQSREHYETLEDQPFGVNRQKFTKAGQAELEELQVSGTSISLNTEPGKSVLHKDSEVQVVVRLHFAVHTHLNLFVGHRGFISGDAPFHG